MRIIISFYYEFLRKKTAAIDIEDEEADCSLLLKAISVKVDRPLHEIVAIVKKDQIPVRIIQGWPLSFYDIRELSQVHVEFKELDNEDTKKKGKAMNNRYLMKLGFKHVENKLSEIRDMDEDENEEQGDGSFKQKKKDGSGGSRNSGSKKKYSSNSACSSSDDESSQKTYDMKKQLANFLEQLVAEIKNNKLEEVRKLFVDAPDRLNQQEKQEFLINKLKAINDLSSDGFNPLHHAVKLRFTEAVKELVDRGANVNTPNRQGWTGLQFAIHKNDIKTLRLLLESPTLDLNYVSQAGTALTMACEFQRPQALQMLLEKNPDVNQTESQGKTCLDFCSNEECRSIVKAHIAKNQSEEETKQDQQQPLQQQQNQDQQSSSLPQQPQQMNIMEQQLHKQQPDVNQVDNLPSKPPIVRGLLYKIGAFRFNIRERYFVVNPDEGTLIRYKQQSHYPMRPMEVIPLKDITHIQMISKSWFMSSDYTYFEINYPNRIVLACKHEKAARKWVQSIFQASVYTFYIESRGNFNVTQLQENVTVTLSDSSSQTDLDGVLTAGSIKEAVAKFERSKQPATQQPQLQITVLPPQRDVLARPAALDVQRNASPKPIATQQQPSKEVEVAVKAGSSSPKTNNRLRDSSPKGVGTSSNNTKSTKDSDSEKMSPRSPPPTEDSHVDLAGLHDEKVSFESFQVMKVLGAGSFGKVFLVKKKDTDSIYAMKALKKRPLILKRQLRYAVTEANVLKMCNHPFVLGLHYALQTPNYLYLVLDYCNGGDISSHLAYKRRFTEDEAIFYIAELILAINHIHEKDVVYRDLKPENILIADDGHIKLADFGLSKDNVQDNEKTKSFCGTPAYLSPEMLNNKGASKASDIYGIGAVLYEMLTGDPPYYNDDIPTMYKRIKEGNLTYPSYVSLKARNLINGLLDRNPKTRLGASDREQLKKDPFFESIDWEKLYNKEYKPPITEFNNSDQEEDFEDLSDKKIFSDFDYEQHNATINRVKQFSFIRK